MKILEVILLILAIGLGLYLAFTVPKTDKKGQEIDKIVEELRNINATLTEISLNLSK